MTGVVVRIFITKGYGFIRDEQDVKRFFNANDMVVKSDFDNIREGINVEFMPAEGPPDKGNGLRAVEVKRCSS